MDVLLAFYESRRRWIFFGSSGQTAQRIFLDGVKKEADSHRFNLCDETEKSVLVLSSIGASNFAEQKISKMGDYRERLFWSSQPFIGNAYSVREESTMGTGSDDAHLFSVDDDVLPMHYFDSNTGEFDTPQAKFRSKVSVNFGNPFKTKRGDAFCPKMYERMSPGRDGTAISDDKAIFQTKMDPANDREFFIIA
jgi:hypothetical protein